MLVIACVHIACMHGYAITGEYKTPEFLATETDDAQGPGMRAAKVINQSSLNSVL